MVNYIFLTIVIEIGYLTYIKRLQYVSGVVSFIFENYESDIDYSISRKTNSMLCQ